MCKCEYSDKDICTKCGTDEKTYCYANKDCFNYKPVKGESPFREKMRLNQYCDSYLDGFTVGV